jgi:predicted regulator of Ras-like GTPase activity (Roadblock/LC7/MglB family)
MSTLAWEASLREVIRVPGVLGALIISADDGLVVAESAMDEIATEDVAALAAALILRSTRCNAAMHHAAPASLHLVADDGALLAVAGPAPLWMVAVTRHDAEFGRVRLLLRDFAVALH